MKKLLKAKSAIIKVAQEYGLSIKKVSVNKNPAFALYEHKEEISMDKLDIIIKEIKHVNTRLDGIDSRLDGIDSRLDGIDSRLDNIVQKNNLSE